MDSKTKIVLSKKSVKPQHSKSHEPDILLSIYTPLALHCYCWPGAKSMNSGVQKKKLKWPTSVIVAPHKS